MKNGFTLIELLLVLSLFSIITIGEVSILSSMINTYKKKISCANELNYMDESLYFIEEQAESSSSVEVRSNNIKFYHSPSDYNEIFCENNKLKIVYDKNGIKSQKYTIADKIKKIEVITCKRIIYVTITGTNGEKMEKCFVIKIIK